MRLNLRISPFQTVIFHFSLANNIVRDIVVEAKVTLNLMVSLVLSYTRWLLRRKKIRKRFLKFHSKISVIFTVKFIWFSKKK